MIGNIFRSRFPAFHSRQRLMSRLETAFTAAAIAYTVLVTIAMFVLVADNLGWIDAVGDLLAGVG